MAEKLIDIVRSEGVKHLTAYFAPGAYAGRWFETFGGRGDRVATADTITAEDLYAVESLSVQVPFRVGRDLVEGRLGAAVSEHLREIPVDVALGTPRAAVLVADGGHADQAWRLLHTEVGVGGVIAGKLLARKRPRLIPVYDAVVRCQFGAPDHVWRKLQAQLAANDGELRAALAGVRESAGLDDETSILRTLDIILWRRHTGSHWRTLDCPQRGGVAL